MYARRNKVVFRVENTLNNIAMQAYASETTLLTWASNVRPESTIMPRSRVHSGHTIIVIKITASTQIIGNKMHHRSLR